uniref:Uncharacterized protein n=2 Tax=Oryza sativa subsp. japonica TaxID=39947 RepID=Q851T4_ORYSJ|nr:hypothetical protein [Oryza sativa Japonica Group]
MDNPRAEHKVERFLSMFYTRTRFQVGDGGQSLSSGDPTDSNRVHSNMGCFQMNITNPMGCLMLPADEHPEISLNPDEEDTAPEDNQRWNCSPDDDPRQAGSGSACPRSAGGGSARLGEPAADQGVVVVITAGGRTQASTPSSLRQSSSSWPRPACSGSARLGEPTTADPSGIVVVIAAGGGWRSGASMRAGKWAAEELDGGWAAEELDDGLAGGGVVRAGERAAEERNGSLAGRGAVRAGGRAKEESEEGVARQVGQRMKERRGRQAG